MSETEFLSGGILFMFACLAASLAWGRSWKRRAKQLEGSWPVAEAVEWGPSACWRCGSKEWDVTYFAGRRMHRCRKCGDREKIR